MPIGSIFGTQKDFERERAWLKTSATLISGLDATTGMAEGAQQKTEMSTLTLFY